MAVDIWWYEARGQWCANVPNPKTGKRERWYLGTDKAEARRKFHLRMAKLYGDEESPGRDTSRGHLTLAELAAAHIEWLQSNRAEKTWKHRRTYLSWIVDKHGFEPAEAITPPQVERIKQAHSRSNAPKSVNHFVRAVKTLYNWAVDQGLLEVNPVARVKRVKAAPVKRLALEDEQVEAALDLADKSPPLGDFMRVLAWTGMRSGELAGLPWSAFDAEQRALIVSDHKTTGGDGQPRIVPLNDKAASTIEAQGIGEGSAIFHSADGRAISRDALWQRWERLRQGESHVPSDPAARQEHRKVLELVEPVTFHALRHTFVSRLLARGVPEWEVQRLVGHSSTLMTRYYAKADMQRLRDAVGRV